MRRIGDLTIACTLIVFTLPLLIAIAAFIKLDGSGPVLTREERRIGGGRPVIVFKFRTSRDAQRDSRSRSWPEQQTGIGRFLHYTRIVDLPQLANVLRGDMSLVDGAARRPDFLA